MSPRIAVSGIVRAMDGVERSGLNVGYLRSVLNAGGVPLILSPVLEPANAEAALEGCAGLVLTGGEDLDPSWYGEAPHPALGDVSAERDRFELALFAAARARELPVLGVCRGLQLINVALGGSLWQDLPSERPADVEHDPHSARHERTHEVRVSRGSRLAAALGVESLLTNSFHHQAIKRLAAGLHASAHAPDGAIEGVESAENEPWLVAVQWHPEEFWRELESPDQHLFRALIGAAISSAIPARG